MADVTDALKQTALDVKRGLRTYSDLDEKTRGEVRAYLRTASNRELREMVEAKRVERSPYRATRTRLARSRTM